MRSAYFYSIFLLLFTFWSGPKKTETIEKNPYPRVGKVERYNPLLTTIIPEDALPEIIAEGFTWAEGPLWLEEINALIFSDVPENKIYQWKEGEGISIYLQPSGYSDSIPGDWEKGSNGLSLSPDRQLIICQHGNRRLVYMDSELENPTSTFKNITTGLSDMPFNSPNDLTITKEGNIYFTDPPYGLYGQDEDIHKVLEFNGVYLYVEGETLILIDSLTRPNGIGLSPDERKLYVANSDTERAVWMVYDLSEDGTIESGKVFYDATSKVPTSVGMPDGLEIHPNGWIFATGPGGLHIFSENGELLGLIDAEGFVSNCAFDENYEYVYMTVNDKIMRIKLNGL